MESESIDILVRGVLIKEGKVLLLKRPAKKGGGYNLVGGHVESGETPARALRREIFEEIGVRISLDSSEMMRVVYRERPGRPPKLHLVFWLHGWEGEITNRDPDKCLGLEWYPLDALPPDLATVAGRVLRLEDQTPFYVEMLPD
ncbi:MAG: NUDIX domain-containing protein [Bacteroidota bacterium]